MKNKPIQKSLEVLKKEMLLNFYNKYLFKNEKVLKIDHGSRKLKSI